MKFRTELKIPESDTKINHSKKILSLGSCFADVLGKQMQADRFDILSNPLGITYNPVLLWGNLHQAPTSQHMIERDSIWYHYLYHSSIHAASSSQLTLMIADKTEHLITYLKTASHLFLTLGTAWVYSLKESKQIVSNCHKMPQELFDKQLLKVNDIVASFHQFRNWLLVLNPHIKIILTVSPVRHIKDTLPLNSVSKSVLLLAVYEICKQYPETEYFPAYELLMDDLRDYRFYADDLLHPSQQAQAYIIDVFYKTYLAAPTIDKVATLRNIRLGIAHRAFHQQSTSHQKFLKDLLEKTVELHQEIPLHDWLAILQNQLNH
jgi:hypothetical protein